MLLIGSSSRRRLREKPLWQGSRAARLLVAWLACRELPLSVPGRGRFAPRPGHILVGLRVYRNIATFAMSRSEPDDIQDHRILGRALRQLRDQAGLRQEELAARAGIGVTYVSQLENGHRGARWHTLRRLLRALGADLHQLADAVADIEKQDAASKR